MQYSNGAYRVGGDIAPPRLMRARQPEYTPEARAARIEGRVELYATIGEDGMPRDIQVTHGLDPGLDQKAIECAREWQFQPGRKLPGRPGRKVPGRQVTTHILRSEEQDDLGEAVPVAAKLVVNFRLAGNDNESVPHLSVND
jgi:TonB family protein